MFLKRLEIYGFKSFADRVEILFHEGITGVVGPNGSGKSNIADAVRWVLGEQSARLLRGAKMEDVIFGGTELRKALAYCEVTLIFDNGDGGLPVEFGEVAVTRRVYRSGDSEYYINKAACRLKDITDMFRDTGIGKEGYSLIGQGRIDEILSVRSEDRRQVFEEAAGISKYRARREESEKKLHNTRQNLERVQDILQEMEGQVGQLAEQADVAKRYLKLAEELKTLELNDFILRHDRYRARVQELEQILAQCAQEESQARGREEALRAEIERTQDDIAEREAALSLEREEMLSRTRKIESGEGNLNVLREQLRQMEQEIARLINEDEAAQLLEQETSRGDGAATDGAKERLLEQKTQIERREGAAASASAELEKAEGALESAKASIIEGMNRLSGVKSSQARMAAMREGYVGRLSQLADREQSARDALIGVQRNADEADKRLGEARAAVGEMRQEAAEIRARATGLAREKDDLTQLLGKTQGALSEAQSRLAMLRQMERDYEGYQHSVREVMRQSKNLPRGGGVLGVVAEIIRVPKEYERAIEMSLGGQLQNIICQTQEDARDRIQALRQARAGRATFLPLDAMRPRVLNQNERRSLSIPGCVGVASELVEFDERFRPVVENLLGRTVIAKDLDAGIAVMRSANHAFRLVTLEGDVMHSGGSMTGGSTQARITSLLSREREIAEHEAAHKRLEERLREQREAIASAEKRLGESRAALLALDDRSREMEIAVEREQAHKSHAEELLAQAREAAENAALERRQLEEAVADIDEQTLEIERQAGGEEEAARVTQRDVERLQAEVLQKRAALEEIREALTALRVAYAAAEREHEARVRDDERRAQELARIREGFTKRAVRREELLSQKENLEAEITRSESELLDMRESMKEREEALRVMEAERTSRQQALREQLESQRVCAQLQTEITERIHKADVQLAKTQGDLQNLINRIWDTYELTYGNALEFKLEEQPQGAAARMEQLRREIRAMGSVNVAAIEDYQNLRERFDTLNTQKNDLEKAERDIRGIIEEITARMEDIFAKQFELLNKNFARTFRALFGGGRAELRLIDSSDVLGSGIEIVAQPPGKKLQLLSLLSGGERALTAIAILFAMLELKPTPFCILDEIEAALDEANIVNFAKFLAGYARKTQFIVVTHRKGTMECCDALYGVAMREKGVSSMVSVEMTALDAV